MKFVAIVTALLGLALGYWLAPVRVLTTSEDPGFRSLLRVRGTLEEKSGTDRMILRTTTPFSDYPTPLVRIRFDERTLWLSAANGRYEVIPMPQVPAGTPLTAFTTAAAHAPLAARYILVGPGV